MRQIEMPEFYHYTDPRPLPPNTAWLAGPGYLVIPPGKVLNAMEAEDFRQHIHHPSRKLGVDPPDYENGGELTRDYSFLADDGSKNESDHSSDVKPMTQQERSTFPRTIASVDMKTTAKIGGRTMGKYIRPISSKWCDSMTCSLAALRSTNPGRIQKNRVPKKRPYPIPAKRQREHTDYPAHLHAHSDLFEHLLCPLSMLIGAEDRETHIRVRPYSTVYYQKRCEASGQNYVDRKMVKIIIPKGGAVLFRGDLYHGGGRYIYENRRGHAYFYMIHQVDGTKPLDKVYPKWDPRQTRRETQLECGGSDEEYI